MTAGDLASRCSCRPPLLPSGCSLPRARTPLEVGAGDGIASPIDIRAAAGHAAGLLRSDPHLSGASTVAVIGDTPYGPARLARFPSDIARMNGDPDVSLVIHLGDVKSGSSACSDGYFDIVKGDFDQFADPLVYTLGDNEWTTSWRGSPAPEASPSSSRRTCGTRRRRQRRRLPEAEGRPEHGRRLQLGACALHQPVIPQRGGTCSRGEGSPGRPDAATLEAVGRPTPDPPTGTVRSGDPR